MSRILRKIALLLSAAVLGLSAQTAMAQGVQFKVPIYVSSGGVIDTLYIGVSGDGPGGTIIDNTIGMDTLSSLGQYREVPAPPAPPAPFAFDARIVTIPGRTSTFPIGLSGGVLGDFRGFFSSTQVDSFKIVIAGDNTDNGNTVVTWPNNLNMYGTSWTIKPQAGTDWPQTDMITGTSVTIPAGLQKNIIIIKVGASAPSLGPTFSVDKGSISFGTVGVGQTKRDSITVTNTGSANNMHLTSAPVLTGAGLTLSTPSAVSYPLTLGPGVSQKYYVTFSPTVSGAVTGTLSFAHDAGGPTSIPVTGTGASSVLSFSQGGVTRFDNWTGYSDSLSLTLSTNPPTAPLKALQFRLVVRDSGLIMRGIAKGSSIASPANAWSLNTVIVRGTVLADGSSNDTVKVVLYGTGSNRLNPGAYSNLLTFQYDAVNISNPDSEFVHLGLIDVASSDSLGFDIGVSAGSDQTVQIKNVTLAGDVNNDDRVDILDLLKVVDHILGKKLLERTPFDEFARADIAPWPAGDGKVNVQDLALLQNIILTGQYPNNGGRVMKVAPSLNVARPLAKSSSLSNGADARITFYLTSLGIAVRLENAVAVKGMQFDLDGVSSVPQHMVISTELGSGYFHFSGTDLRVLVYDQVGAVLPPSERLVANLPFALDKPADVKVKGVILAGIDNRALSKVEVTTTLETAPELPIEFQLLQNFPNPFNPTTTISFSVPQTSPVKISIFNVLGQEVRTLFEGSMERGTKVMTFDGRDNAGHVLASGTYIYRMTAGTFTENKKMMLLK